MIKRFRRPSQNRRRFRTNEHIYAPSLRVLDNEGKQIGVMARFEALQMAREQQLDLVEIAPSAKPPVAKIIDFKKFLYQTEKKRRDEKRKAKNVETKEVRLGPFMNEHDLEVMTRRAREFLEGGHKVRFVLRFIGRQITHPEFGKNVMDRAVSSVADISKIEREVHFEGRQLVAILSAQKGVKHEEKDQEVSRETV